LFQAEDGIRRFHVTGVQTCALPIYGNVQLAGVDAIKITQALECLPERAEIVVTGLVGRGMRVRKRGGRDARTEETVLPIQDGARSEERRGGKESRTTMTT